MEKMSDKESQEHVLGFARITWRHRFYPHFTPQASISALSLHIVGSICLLTQGDTWKHYILPSSIFRHFHPAQHVSRD